MMNYINKNSAINVIVRPTHPLTEDTQDQKVLSVASVDSKIRNCDTEQSTQSSISLPISNKVQEIDKYQDEMLSYIYNYVNIEEYI